MPESAELVAAADTLAEASLYKEAISTYSKAIELHPTAPAYFVKRSTAYQRSGNLDDALKDAEQAVVLAGQRGKADLIASAQFRRGISLNGLKRYRESNEAFALAKKSGSKEKSIDIWIAKNNRGLAKGDTNASAPPPPSPSRETPSTVKAADNTLSDLSIEPSKESVPHKTHDVPKIPAPAPTLAPVRIRHEWYQTDQNVMVDIFYKNVPKDKCTVDFESNSFTVSFPLSGGSDFSFSIDPLTKYIDPSTSSYEILSTKISLKLTKAMRGLKWSGLEGTHSTTTSTTTIPTKPTPTTTTASKGIAYPTSSRHGTKNWDAIEREIIKDSAEWEKPDGDAAANALFRELFKNATPEARRAMEKSYVESNGTALSTNWEEVSRGKVETKPPDSMVAKKWGA